MNNEATGALIRTLRKEKKLTQKELAQRLNVTDRAVLKWERGVSHS
ncbi:helix-turn-helix domain-containing protein [Candidatus Allofournierella excrementavium]